MRDDFDPDLANVFTRANEPLADTDFAAGLLRKIERARRARLLRQILIVAAAVIVVSLNLHLVLENTAVAVRGVGELTPWSSDFLTTPWGWTASMLFGAGMLFYFRPSRRR